ncbi:hypothetical protein E2562_024823 [Oryza meyeriana var. granulata]|uniref:Uncharacterized protein n=1 Tax=Oryza meyeriana var. granulata TaxID=110450 RepID=A0A6G1FBL3_9ORYZ|nr:hypothetical protein E2562_024823 [Oryza meyeriana var. granulata]
MAVDALSIIPCAVMRNLSDKLYEKRKNAVLKIEGIVKQLAMTGEHDKISAVIALLTNDFIMLPQANHRKFCGEGGRMSENEREPGEFTPIAGFPSGAGDHNPILHTTLAEAANKIHTPKPLVTPEEVSATGSESLDWGSDEDEVEDLSSPLC